MTNGFKRKFPLCLLLWGLLASGTATAAETTNSTALSFQAPVEMVLNADGILGARAYLSFDSNNVTVEKLSDDPARNRRLHRDVKFDFTPGSEEWTGIDLQVAPATEESWNAPADKVIAELADNLAPPLPTMQITPGVWFFKTGRGQYGLMRIVGYVERRPGFKGMKLVYKLAVAVSQK